MQLFKNTIPSPQEHGMTTESNSLVSDFPSPRARKRAAKWRLSQIHKLAQGCADCGYNASAYALQFDHVRGDKKANVSDLIRSDYKWETVLEEISKCEVVCANCHAIRTKTRGQHHSVMVVNTDLLGDTPNSLSNISE